MTAKFKAAAFARRHLGQLRARADDFAEAVRVVPKSGRRVAGACAVIALSGCVAFYAAGVALQPDAALMATANRDLQAYAAQEAKNASDAAKWAANGAEPYDATEKRTVALVWTVAGTAAMFVAFGRLVAWWEWVMWFFRQYRAAGD